MTTPYRPPSTGAGLRPIEGRNLDAFEPEGYRDAPPDDFLDDNEPGFRDRLRGWLRRLAIRVAWLALVAGVALGSAGAAAVLQPAPTNATRPELTWGADQAITSRLDAATRDLVMLSDDVDELGTMTRQTLSSLAQVNGVTITAAWNGGANASNAIAARAADLTTRLACEPWDTTRELELSKTNSKPVIDRYHSVCRAIASVAPLRDDWNGLVSGSRTAMQVATDINNHDQIGADALQLATDGRYSDALARLATASASVSDATTIATQLAKVTDVSTLQDWLTRTTAMDQALAVLWQSMIDSNGRITAQVTAALKNVNAAKELLPSDSSVLQVVMYEVAGSLTANGISIETARYALSSALADLLGTVQGQ